MLTQPEVAWVAGVVDARALLTVRWSRNTRLPVLAVNGNDDATRHVQRILGGMVGAAPVPTMRDYNRVDCVDHCTEKHTHVRVEVGALVLHRHPRHRRPVQRDAAPAGETRASRRNSSTRAPPWGGRRQWPRTWLREDGRCRR